MSFSLLFGPSNSEKMHVPLVLCQNTRGLAYSREKVAGFIQPLHGIGLVLSFTQEKMNLGRKLRGLSYGKSGEEESRNEYTVICMTISK